MLWLRAFRNYRRDDATLLVELEIRGEQNRLSAHQRGGWCDDIPIWIPFEPTPTIDPHDHDPRIDLVDVEILMRVFVDREEHCAFKLMEMVDIARQSRAVPCCAPGTN